MMIIWHRSTLSLNHSMTCIHTNSHRPSNALLINSSQKSVTFSYIKSTLSIHLDVFSSLFLVCQVRCNFNPVCWSIWIRRLRPVREWEAILLTIDVLSKVTFWDIFEWKFPWPIILVGLIINCKKKWGRILRGYVRMCKSDMAEVSSEAITKSREISQCHDISPGKLIWISVSKVLYLKNIWFEGKFGVRSWL